MRNDQIFVLMLVILLPLSGCLDGAIGDAEAEETEEIVQQNHVNQEPLIYGSLRNCYHECYYDGDWYDSFVIIDDLFTTDPDGNITNFGMDWDNDFQIDWSFSWNWNVSYSETMNAFNYTQIQINAPANPDSDSKCESDYFNLISEDERGLKEIQPMRFIFDWDDDNGVCLVGPRN